MDPEIRQMLEQAYAQDDLARADYEQTRSGNDSGLIYKTYVPQPMKQQSAAMDPETEAKWNTWCKSLIERALAERPPFSSAQRDAIGMALSEIRSQLRQEINALRKDVDQLTNDLRLVRGEMDGSVKTMRGRDADAA